MQIIETPTVHDVCIVGSGAGGGMAAHELTKAGMNVVMLEAGPMWDSADDGAMFGWPWQSVRRGAPSREKPFGDFDGCLGGWDIAGEPYTVEDGTEWEWFRARMLGGRTNHWGRISLRFGPDDFRRKSIDGQGDDWPITYEDLAPYYDYIDDLIGIFGNADNFPNEPDGHFLPAPLPRAHEMVVSDACRRLRIPVLASRLSILTQPLNGRPKCHFCSQCGRGCATHSNFSSPSVLLPPALATGRLEIIPNAMAREVTTDDNGRASGVSYVDTQDLQEYQVRAKVVVLAASACESARLMLNSKSRRHPNGIGNGSDVVGRYITDSPGASAAGFIPRLMDMPPHNQDGVGGMHIYIPWWLDGGNVDFPRGYHIETWGGRNMPGYGFGRDIQRLNALFPLASGGRRARGGGGYGAELKQDYRRTYGSVVGFSGRGEMIARYENYCEINPNVVDKYGIPVLHFNVRWSDDEYRQVRHMQETFREIIQAMGGTSLSDMPTQEEGYGITAPGLIIHEVGTTRMGANPRTSVLNAQCQSHEVDNLFVADAGPFVSQAHKNPTWTILALAARTSAYITDQMQQGNLA